ncbi:zinc finger MYM-type protein 1-like [Lepidochelys kempii]|uniref:zinc finger MYM-type protein 1-like n=1 Tax=Lepidochelys kempii TaxID=8472 RepID=UPI003C6F3428
MADREKLSGAQFCKQKADKQKEERKQEGSFLRYQRPLARDEGSPMPKDQAEMEVGMTVSQVKEEFEEHNLNIADESYETHEDQNLEERESENVTCLNLSFRDPATWAKCDDQVRQILVEHELEQVQQFDFPKIVSKENSRQFISNVGLLMEKKCTISGCSIPHQMILLLLLLQVVCQLIKDKEMHVHYLGKGIQNELIQLLSNAIKQKILASARAAKYFSVILDCTPDAGHVEQMTMNVRFVDRPTSETENETESVCIKEHFLGLVSLTETTGAGMTETILHQLEEMSLPIENLRGQGYDNGSNMKGKENGLGDIYDALLEIYDNTTLTGSSGNMSQVDAKDLAKAISSFKFLVSLVVWYDILFEINMIRKQLQAKEFNVSDAINQLGEIKKFLVGHRIDIDFEKTLVDAGELAEELDVLALFEPDTICIRKKRKQFTYEADDKPIYNPKEKFKVNFYFAVIDTTIHSVEERLTLMQQISSVFGFLYDVYSLQNTRPKQIMEHCLNLEQALQHGESKDIDAFDLCNELQAITRRVQKVHHHNMY